MTLTASAAPPRTAPPAAGLGGPGAAAAVDRHLAAAPALEQAVWAPARSAPTRLRAAAGLLLAAVVATGLDWAASLAWLRGDADPADPGDGTRVPADEAGPAGEGRFAAESAFLRNEAEWTAWHRRARAEAEAAGTGLGEWRRHLAETLAELRGLEQAGHLDAPAAAVFRRLVGAHQQRIGLTAAERAQAAWLVSLAVLRAAPRGPFFADGPDALDRRLHEEAKYAPATILDQMPDLVGAGFEGRQPLPVRGTPLPLGGRDADLPGLAEVLLARRSAYGTYAGPLTADDLGRLLYHTAAVTGEKTMDGADAPLRVRPHPSGGNRYPVRLLAYCHDVAGVPRGLHLYDPDAHALLPLDARDLTGELIPAVPATDPRLPATKAGGKIDAAGCPLWLFLVADLTYQRLHYGLRSYRLVLLEGGHVAQNLSLVSTGLGLSSVGLCGFYDDALHAALGLDGVNSAVLYTYLVGRVSTPA
ncbi:MULTISPECIES: SagB family peptide dehydrogenase [unclassified Micromonospora]|uniref:SagB family peptide dehydrogenase n=2 Tax=Micromonospora TaxID=1873 RepID=UPI0013D236D7|nr:MULTISPECIES: SagB family peptide dehydrogenase [unclassified Micromonospora]NES15064.1 SagB/ThcOx family dehydrogenase [Micromonospora sp. PPF5-17B]NES56261.1 SagB/ThcOx family dehydrogenase [Micromonospora sp. PPF5-6]